MSDPSWWDILGTTQMQNDEGWQGSKLQGSPDKEEEVMEIFVCRSSHIYGNLTVVHTITARI